MSQLLFIPREDDLKFSPEVSKISIIPIHESYKNLIKKDSPLYKNWPNDIIKTIQIITK